MTKHRNNKEPNQRKHITIQYKHTKEQRQHTLNEQYKNKKTINSKPI